MADEHEKKVAEARKQRDGNRRKSLEADTDRIIRNIEQAAAKNPAIDQSVFAALAEELQSKRAEMTEDVIKKMDELANPRDERRVANEVRDTYFRAIHDQMVADHGDAGKQAMIAVAREGQAKSLFAGPAKAFFNSENGGPQWGGIIGGLGAAAAGYFMTQGAGTFLNILGTLAVTAIGTYVGHSLIDPRPEPLVVPNFHTPAKAEGVASALEKKPDLGAILAKESAIPKPSTELDAKALGIKNENLAELTGRNLV